MYYCVYEWFKYSLCDVNVFDVVIGLFVVEVCFVCEIDGCFVGICICFYIGWVFVVKF